MEFHLTTNVRKELDRHERSRVHPVFEQRGIGVVERGKLGSIIVAGPGPDRGFVRSRNNADGIELDDPDVLNKVEKMRFFGKSPGAFVERFNSLGEECQVPGFVKRDEIDSSGGECHFAFPRDRSKRSRQTTIMASRTIRRESFDLPATRSENVIGTSITVRPRLIAR